VTVRTLVDAAPRDPATGALTPVFLGGGGRAPLHHNGRHYRAGILSVPVLAASIQWDDRGWTGGSIPTSGSIIFAPADRQLLDALGRLFWRGADLVISVGPDAGPFVRYLTGTCASARVPDAGPFVRYLTGTCASARVAGPRLIIEAADLSSGIDRPLVTARFAGSGGLEGIAEAAGRPKRRSWGRVFNVEGRLLDKANSIYEFGDPARPLQDITVVRDKGRDGARAVLPWQGSAAATFAALQAGSAPAGGALVAPSIACAKWFTVPVGPVTADLLGEVGGGYVERPAAIAERVLQAVGGPAMSAAVRDAADLARPYAVGVHVGSETETAAQVIDRLLLGVSMLWTLDATGAVRISPITLAAPSEAVRSVDVTRDRQMLPSRTRRVGYRRNERPHSDGEIALVLTEGAEAITAQLTRPAATVSAGTNGEVNLGDLPALGGRFQVQLGGVPVSPAPTFSVVADAGLDAVIDAAGDYRARAADLDTGTARFRAVWNGLSFEREYSLSRVRRGQPGISPPLITVSGTHAEFRYDGAGDAKPQTTRLTARRQNTALQTIWRVLRADTGAPVSLFYTAADMAANGWVDSAPSDDEVVLGHVRFGWLSDAYGAGGGLVYEAWLNGTSIVDRWPLARALDGADGLDGANAYNVTLDGLARNGGTFSYTGAGDGNAISVEVAAQGRASAVVGPVLATFGIGLRDPGSGTVYELIRSPAAFWGNGTTIWRHWSGVVAVSTGVATAPGLLLEVAHVGTEMRGYINGTDIGTPIATGIPADRAHQLWVRAAGAPGQRLDSVSFSRSGAPGAAGQDGRSITPAATTITLSADYLGTIKPGQLPRAIAFACFAGGADVTGQTSWAVESVSSDGSAASISAGGLLTVSALASTSSLIVVRAIYQGTVLRARVGAAVVLDPAPPATATNLSVTVPSPGDESTFPPSPDAAVTVSASPGGQIRADMGASYFVGGNAPFPQTLSWTAIAKLAYRLAGSGGAWVDIGVQEVGTAARRGWLAPGEPESNSGGVNISRIQGGLTAGAAYEVGIFVRASASGPVSGWQGTMTAGHP
jgi:hypothetical protein